MSKKRKSEKTVVRGAMRPLTKAELAAIVSRLVRLERWRDHALICTGIDSMLRASDLTRIRVEEITDNTGAIVSEAQVRMKKTGKIASFRITAHTRDAIKKLLDDRFFKSSPWLFHGLRHSESMTESRYRQIVKESFKAIGLDARHYSTHSIRRTKATIMYDQTNDIKAVAELLGHSNVTMTEKYIGMTRKKALDLSDTVDIWS